MANLTKPINRITSTLSRGELKNMAQLRKGAESKNILKAGAKDIFGGSISGESIRAKKHREYLKRLNEK